MPNEFTTLISLRNFILLHQRYSNTLDTIPPILTVENNRTRIIKQDISLDSAEIPQCDTRLREKSKIHEIHKKYVSKQKFYALRHVTLLHKNMMNISRFTYLNTGTITQLMGITSYQYLSKGKSKLNTRLVILGCTVILLAISELL